MNRPRLIQIQPKPQPSGISNMVSFVRIIPNDYVEKARSHKSIIFLFLGSPRSVIIPIVTIPLSLIGVMSIMLALGYSLNLLTYILHFEYHHK